MSSFRRPKSEAALRLYSLPRRELQALCKQYGIPANKTNVAMADALSACVPADNAKLKASAGSSLGVAKTTDMKLKLEKKVGLPETALASFILTGKRKASPTKVAEQLTEVEDSGFPMLNTTPLKRGVKKPVLAVQEEKSKVTAVPAFTRALQDRIGKVSSAPAVRSPKPPVPTPRKRAAEAAAVVTRRGGDALPPVSFYDLVSSPGKRQVHEIIELNSIAKTANKRRTRLALKTEQQEEESALPLSHAAGAEYKVSKGKRVVFADEVEAPKTASPEPEPKAGPESGPETETIEVSYAEIEFKDAAIHKELFGFQTNKITNQEQDVAPLLKEDLENREDAIDSEMEMEIEFRDRALHEELFGAHMEGSDPCAELVGPSLDLQQVSTSASAVELESQERRSFDTATSYPAESLIDSNNLPVQDHSVLSSICEDAFEGSDRQGQALDEPTEQNLAQVSDPRPLPNDVCCDDLVENLCEKGSEVPEKECPLGEVQSDCGFTLQQELTLISSSADSHVAIDDVRGLEDTEHQLENQEVVMLVDGNVQQHQSENQEAVTLVDGNTEQDQSENNDVVMLVSGDTEQKQSENHEVVMPVGDDIQEHQSENHEVVMVVDADIKHHQSENHEVVLVVDADIKHHQSENHEVVLVVDADIKHHQSENHEVVMVVDADIKHHQSENHEVVMVVDADIKHHQSENRDIVDGLGDKLLTEQCPEETFLSSVPVPDEAQKAQSISSLESDEVQRSSLLDEKEKIEASPNVASAKSLVAVGPELVMASPSSPSIPVTPVMKAQDNSTKRLSGPASSNISATPVAVAQVHSAKRLSGPGTFSVPVTPVPKADENSSELMSGLRSANVPVTPAANAQDNSAQRKRNSNISATPPTNAHHDSVKLFSVPSSASIPVTPVTKLRDNSDSALAEAATPLTKVQSNIDSTLAKANSILEKLAAWRADAEKKVREGYWEPKFSTGVESSASDVERPLAKPVLAVNGDVLSAKKARPPPKSVLGSEKPLNVCEDTDIVSKVDRPSATKMRTSDETRDSLEVSDKENQSDKSIDSDKSFRKMGGLGKDKKKGKKFEVLKDRSKNLPDLGTGLAPIKESTGLIRPGDMSLRKLRAQVKQKVSQLETSKASPLRPQKAWNTSH